MLKNCDTLKFFYLSPGTPIILVGAKSNLRDNSPTPDILSRDDQPLLSYSDGFKCMKSIKAVRYTECSFLSQRGLEEVFIEAVRTVLDVKKAKQANGIFSGSLSHCTKHT